MANGLILNVDTTKSEFQNPMVELRQGDGNYQSLHVTVTNNGDPVDLTDWTITFMGTTAGAHKIVDANAVVDNALQGTFNYTPTKAWGQDIGEFNKAYFKFVKSDETASGANFRVNVLEAVDLTDEEAGDYISVVDSLIEKVKTDMDAKLADTQETLTKTQNQANTVQTNVDDLNNNVNELKAQNNNLLTSDNTWTGINKFDKPIYGNFQSQLINTNDLTVIAQSMQKYSGNWQINSNTTPLVGQPNGLSPKGLYTLTVVSSWPDAGYFILTNMSEDTYIGHVIAGTIKNWVKMANDSTVVHNTGNETIAGNKTFTGTTSIKSQDVSYLPTNLDYYTERINAAQDMTVIGDQLLIFSGTTTDHSVIQNVQAKVLSSGYSATGSLIDYSGTAKTHNLGHVNGVDFINSQLSSYYSTDLTSGYLVAYNGSGLPPEVSLFENITQSTSFFDIANSTNIIFKEGNKTLDGDGSVSFGGDFRTLILSRVVDSKTIGLRIVSLGTGTNDFSDKTSDNSDMTLWGTFKSGKTDYQYNGTAKIVSDIKVDSSVLSGSNQPQGQTYKGNSVYMGVGFTGSHIIEIKVFSGYGKIINDFYPNSSITNGHNGEVEGVAIHEGELLGLSSPSSSGQNALFYKIKLFGNSNSVKTYGDQNITGSKTFSNSTSMTSVTANSLSVSGATTFYTTSFTWTSGIMQGKWTIQRMGAWVFAKFDLSSSTSTGTTTLSLPAGLRPLSNFARDLEGGNAGMGPTGTVYISTAYTGNNGMTFSFPTADAFPTS